MLKLLDGLDEFTGALLYWWCMMTIESYWEGYPKHFWDLLDNRQLDDR
jgi:hypothetical protein